MVLTSVRQGVSQLQRYRTDGTLLGSVDLGLAQESGVPTALAVEPVGVATVAFDGVPYISTDGSQVPSCAGLPCPDQRR